MQPQLYRNVEHPGLGLLQVLEAIPIPAFPGKVDYSGDIKVKKHFYDVLVQNERGIKFTLKNVFWPSFVPVSQESPVPKEKEQPPKYVSEDLQKAVEYSALVDRTAPASTKEYCGLLKEVFQKEGILKAVQFDFEVSVERLANFYIFR